MRFAFLVVATLALAACEEGRACPSETACPKGSSCRCDDAGRLLLQRGDLNGDGAADEIRYTRDESGAVLTQKTDFSRDGAIEREATYLYDAEGRMTGRKGWQLRCDRSRFQWECSFETPCPAPYDACSKCENRFELDQGKGFQPCGATAVKEKQAE